VAATRFHDEACGVEQPTELPADGGVAHDVGGDVARAYALLVVVSAHVDCEGVLNRVLPA
jgi:hypothetical protein